MISDPTRLLPSNPDVEKFSKTLTINQARTYAGSHCWEPINPPATRYVYFMAQSSPILRHRFALQVVAGQPLGKLHALHYCDNKHCCNPAHLYAGTDKDNGKDRVDRGQQPRRSRHGRAVLTEGKVILIRAIYALPDRPFTMPQIAAMLGVSRSAVAHVVYRHNWK